MSTIKVTTVRNEQDSTAVSVNRTVSDGNILNVSKDGTIIGSLGSASGDVYLDSASGDIQFQNGGTESLRIDSNGNVGIGTATPSSFSGYSTLTVNNATNGGLLEVQNNGTTYGQIFTDGSTFNIRSSASSSALVFDTNGGNERMRIDTNGNVGIGTTPSSSWRTAFDMQALQIGQTGALANLDVSTTDRRLQLSSNAYLNSSGDFIRILEGHATLYQQKAGNHKFYTASNSTAGSTATMTETMRIDSGGDVQFLNSDGNVRLYWDHSAAGLVSAGSGISFDSGSNYLDDYEEGTWTPVIRISNSATGITFDLQAGSYTKIGRQVTCHGALIFSDKGSNTGAVTLDNIPFAVADLISGTSVEAVGVVGYVSNMSSNFTTMTLLIGANGSTEAEFYYQNAADTAMNGLNGNNIADNTTMRFSFTYFTNT